MSFVIIHTDGAKPLFKYVGELKKLYDVKIERTMGRWNMPDIVIKDPGPEILAQIKELEWVLSVKEWKDILLKVVMDDD